MTQKIQWGTYFKTPREIRNEYIKAAWDMVNKYGWQDRMVYPYSFGMKVTKILEDMNDFDRCTSGSKEYLVSLFNGLVDILNAWERDELEEKIEVRIITSGKVIKINKKDLDMFEGLVEAI